MPASLQRQNYVKGVRQPRALRLANIAVASMIPRRERNQLRYSGFSGARFARK